MISLLAGNAIAPLAIASCFAVSADLKRSLENAQVALGHELSLQFSTSSITVEIDGAGGLEVNGADGAPCGLIARIRLGDQVSAVRLFCRVRPLSPVSLRQPSVAFGPNSAPTAAVSAGNRVDALFRSGPRASSAKWIMSTEHTASIRDLDVTGRTHIPLPAELLRGIALTGIVHGVPIDLFAVATMGAASQAHIVRVLHLRFDQPMRMVGAEPFVVRFRVGPTAQRMNFTRERRNLEAQATRELNRFAAEMLAQAASVDNSQE